MNRSKARIYIDSENMSNNLIDKYLSIGNEYGEIISKKAYGDFSNQTLAPWKKAEKEYAMDLVHVSSSGKGKSTTDIKLIVDLLSDFYHNTDNVFILISNDSDFIEVSKKIRDENGTIININMQDKAGPLSHSFTHTHSVAVMNSQIKTKTNTGIKAKNKTTEKIITNSKVIDEIKKILVSSGGDSHPVQVTKVTEALYKTYSKKEVQKAIGYSNNEGITGGLKKLGMFKIKKKKLVHYIMLSDTKTKDNEVNSKHQQKVKVESKAKKKKNEKLVINNKDRVMDEIKKIIVNHGGDSKPVQLSKVTADLYKVIKKKDVKKAIGYSSKDGIAGGLEKIDCFVLTKEDNNYFILLKDHVKSTVVDSPKTYLDDKHLFQLIKQLIDSVPQKKIVDGFVPFHLVTLDLIRNEAISKEMIKDTLKLSSYNHFSSELKKHGFSFKKVNYLNQKLDYIKY